MPNAANFNEISLKLSSIDVQIRTSAFSDLIKNIKLIEPNYLTRISAGLFYYYLYADTIKEQIKIRSEILELMDKVNNDIKQSFRTIFLESLVKMWESLKKEKIQIFLLFLKEFFFKVYTEFYNSTNFKSNMVNWNDFLSTCIIFNSKGVFISFIRCFGVIVCVAKNKESFTS